MAVMTVFLDHTTDPNPTLPTFFSLHVCLSFLSVSSRTRKILIKKLIVPPLCKK